jgi:hypothetical protein
MNTNTAEITEYVTAKGMTRYSATCSCGVKISGKFYPAQVHKALAAHECKGA